MKTQALKACPFCGGTEIFIEPDERSSCGQWVSPVHVGCVACKCEQRGDEQEDAVAAWNRRIPTSQAAPLPVARELLHASVIKRIWKECRAQGLDYVAFAWRIERAATTPIAPDARKD